MPKKTKIERASRSDGRPSSQSKGDQRKGQKEMERMMLERKAAAKAEPKTYHG
jgi:hypothetical protein